MTDANETAPSLEERERRGRSGLPIELVLIRHAEPDWEAARQSPEGDPGLTALGRRQAEALAEHLRRLPIAAIFSSPLQRARQTAAAVAAVQGIEVSVVDDLEELRVPLQANASQSEVDAYFRAAANRSLREHWEGFPGGEPFRAFHERATGAITSVLAHFGVRPDRADEFVVWSTPARAHTLRLGVVAHGGTNGVVLTHLLGIPPVPWEWIRFETPLAAYSVLGLRPINEQGHIWSLQQFGCRADAADLAEGR